MLPNSSGSLFDVARAPSLGRTRPSAGTRFTGGLRGSSEPLAS
jgi:hypothetical protein